jgi:hypothetical protein
VEWVSAMRYSQVCYNERCYNERMLQRTVFVNKIGMLQRTRRNTIGRRSTRVRMTCRDLPALIRASVIFVIVCKVQLLI